MQHDQQQDTGFSTLADTTIIKSLARRLSGEQPVLTADLLDSLPTTLQAGQVLDSSFGLDETSKRRSARWNCAGGATGSRPVGRLTAGAGASGAKSRSGSPASRMRTMASHSRASAPSAGAKRVRRSSAWHSWPGCADGTTRDN
jgi:hypothetical protein